MRFDEVRMAWLLQAGGGARSSYEPDDASRHLVRRVREGLDRKEFALNFQPMWHIGSRLVTGVECLLRWNHPTRGMLLPSMFPEVFADDTAARDVFDFVLDRACRELSMFDPHWQVWAPRMSINVDASVLSDTLLSEQISAVARRYGVNPCMLDLEVVETHDASALLSSSKCTAPLKFLGVRLLCDDFGVANPPLSTLSSMRIDGIKLDKEFLRGVPHSRRSAAVLKSMLELCAELKLRVITEGVENKAQFEWLARYEHIEVQGFFIARPQMSLAGVWESLFKAPPSGLGLAH